MDINGELLEAIAWYSERRKRISRGIGTELMGKPVFGGKDILSWINRIEKPNVTALSEVTGLTRGGTSKAVARLAAAGWLHSYQSPDNRKEVYYRLTPDGEAALSRLNRTMELLHARELEYIQTLSDDQKHAALRFFLGFTEHLARVWPPETDETEDEKDS